MLSTDRLFQSIQFLKGVGPQRKKRLKNLGIETVFDLLWLIPRNYIAGGIPNNLQMVPEGKLVSMRGFVQGVHSRKSKHGMTIFTAMVKDGSLLIPVTWFNQPYISGLITLNQEILVVGRVKEGYAGMELHATDYELLKPDDLLKYCYLPIYPLVEGVNQKFVRRLILKALNEYLHFYPEIIEKRHRDRYRLCGIQFALNNIHFPQNRQSFKEASRRLAIEEMLLLQINFLNKRLEEGLDFVQHKPAKNMITGMVNQLPYKLTKSQKKVLAEIFEDMDSARHMNRLIQGDVGSGKTVIAILAMAKSVAGGFQASLMAPTEILAEQHYKSVKALLGKNNIKVACLTKSCSAKEKRNILAEVASGEIDILVGTHSIIQDKVLFKRLGLAVIDEQHRFGVKQRSLLEAKGCNPDVLVMTATPIPRTLALVLYGELNVSTIDELPPGRKPIKTIWVKTSETKALYNFIRKRLLSGEQAYFVCPLIEETENQGIKDAVSLYNELADIYPELKIGLIHGRVNSQDKDSIMRQFKSGEIRILVATTVIEVGIDVPGASIMVVEQAERFGLSQLHQLRGRVGRGNKQAFCFLVGNPKTEEAYRRLAIVQESDDGFRLAEEDLKIRGPGEIYGMKQHGLNQLKVANLIDDHGSIKISQALCKDLDIANAFKAYHKYIKQKFPDLIFIAQN